MSKKMVTTQPGLFLFTDKNSAFQVTETGATVNGKELTMREAWAWLMDAIDAKAKQVPDPETGLLPCGCGGIPEFIEDKTEPKFGIYTVMCSKCNIRLSGYTNRIDFLKIDWNRAMGWRVEG